MDEWRKIGLKRGMKNLAGMCSALTVRGWVTIIYSGID
jgi:hypothetical protein